MNIQTFSINMLAVSTEKAMEMYKAKKAYKEEFPECAVCGCQKGLEVHHVKPVHLYPDLSCSRYNFITLCDNLLGNNGCHNKLGHFNNFKSFYNTKIRELAVMMRFLRTSQNAKKKFIISTDTLIKEFSTALQITEDEFIARCTNFKATE